MKAASGTYSEESAKRLRDLYIEQEKNSIGGDELYGVTERLSKNDYIKGEMQNYLLDYYIHEIDLRGKEAELTNTTYPCRVPADNTEIRKLPFIEKGLLNTSTFGYTVVKVKGLKQSSEYFDVEVDYLNNDEIKELHEGLGILEDIKPGLICHESRSKRFRDKKCLRFRIYDGKDEKFKEKWTWKNNAKPFLHFSLRTSNTLFRKPLNTIADLFGMKPQDFQFAQLKEALPVSYQKVSVKRPERGVVEKLLNMKQNTFKVGNCEFRSRPLKIGDLFGNKYQIAIRGLQKESETAVKKCLNELKDIGFINYFGSKRFCCRRCVPVYEVGKALLNRNWKEAVDLLLRPTSEDPDGLKKFKERWFLSGGDVTKVFQDGFTSEEYEFQMIVKLGTDPHDFEGALEVVPFNFRLGWVFAYQSYIWNVIASQRIKRKGLKLVPGDTVFVGKKEEELKPEFYDDYGIPLYSRSKPYEALERDPLKKPIFKDMIHFVTQEEIDANKYTIYDLVLPTPGSAVLFPKNEVGIWYTDFLSRDGLNKTRLGDKYFSEDQIVMNSYFLFGTYRRVLLRPEEFTWDFKKYTSINDPIIATASSRRNNQDNNKKRSTQQGSEKHALMLEFTLPADAYVLSAMREIIDVTESGFNNMIVKHDAAKEKEAKEMEELKIKKEKEKQAAADVEKNKPKERLDGGIKAASRSKSKGASLDRTVKTSKANFIEVRLTNPENARNKDGKKQQSGGTRHDFKPSNRAAPPAANFGSFDMPGPLQPGPRMIDGVQVYEFQTLPQFAPLDNDQSMNDSFDVNPAWEALPQRQSVFDGGRLADKAFSGSRLRSEYDPVYAAHQEREFEEGRLLEAPPWLDQRMNNDDLRNQLRLQRNPVSFERDRDMERIPLDIPSKRASDRYSPELALKLRRLDEEALRNDVERNRKRDWEPSPFDRLGPRFEEDERARLRRELDSDARMFNRQTQSQNDPARIVIIDDDDDEDLRRDVQTVLERNKLNRGRDEMAFDPRRDSSPRGIAKRIETYDLTDRRRFDDVPERREFIDSRRHDMRSDRDSNIPDRFDGNNRRSDIHNEAAGRRPDISSRFDRSDERRIDIQERRSMGGSERYSPGRSLERFDKNERSDSRRFDIPDRFDGRDRHSPGRRVENEGRPSQQRIDNIDHRPDISGRSFSSNDRLDTLARPSRFDSSERRSAANSDRFGMNERPDPQARPSRFDSSEGRFGNNDGRETLARPSRSSERRPNITDRFGSNERGDNSGRPGRFDNSNERRSDMSDRRTELNERRSDNFGLRPADSTNRQSDTFEWRNENNNDRGNFPPNKSSENFNRSTDNFDPQANHSLPTRPTPSFDDLKSMHLTFGQPPAFQQRKRSPSPPRNVFGNINNNNPGLNPNLPRGLLGGPMRGNNNNNFAMQDNFGPNNDSRGGMANSGGFQAQGFNQHQQQYNQFNAQMQQGNPPTWNQNFQEQNGFNPPPPPPMNRAPPMNNPPNFGNNMGNPGMMRPMLQSGGMMNMRPMAPLMNLNLQQPNNGMNRGGNFGPGMQPNNNMMNFGRRF